MWIVSVIGLVVLLNTQVMLFVMLLFSCSVFVLSVWIFPRLLVTYAYAPELGMLIFYRYSGKFLLISDNILIVVV